MTDGVVTLAIAISVFGPGTSGDGGREATGDDLCSSYGKAVAAARFWPCRGAKHI